MKNYYSNLITFFLFVCHIAVAQQMPLDFSDSSQIFSVWGGSSFSTRPSPTDSNNTIGQFFHSASAAEQGFYIDLIRPIDLDSNSTITLAFYAEDPQQHTVGLKLEQGDNAPIQLNLNVTSQNSWTTLTYDFSTIGGNGNYNRLTILIDIGSSTPGAFFIDNIDDGSIPIASPPDPIYNYLVWSDEFDGTGGINTSNWFHQTIPIINGQDWANGEIQHYTDRNINSYMENGSLKILAKKETYTNQGVTKQYTSARLNSKFAFTYGKVEIRAKMPYGIGTFPALWMLGQNITETGGYWAATHGTTGWPDCGEIDIIEHWGENQDFVQSALHNRSSFGGTVNKGGRLISNASTEFHIYTLDWNSNKMTFSVDGIVHYVYNPVTKTIQNWPYNAPQYLLFNVAILPNIASNFTESAMEIDYVRVYQTNPLSIDKKVLNDLKVYPNPSHTIINISSQSVIDKVKLYDSTGKLILTKDKKPKDVNIMGIRSGFYLLKIYSGEAISTKKVVIN